MILFFSALSNMTDYFLVYTKKAMAWEEQYKPLFNYLSDVENDYQIIYFRKMNRHPYIYQSFYQKIDPNYFLNNVKRENFEVLELGKYKYIDNNFNFAYCNWNNTGKRKSLYVANSNDVSAKPKFYVNSYNNVHRLVSVYDIEEVEKELKQNNNLPLCDIK